MTVCYDLRQVTEHVGAALAAAEAQVRLEQAVRGLDSLDELGLHEVLARGLGAHYEVAREVPYPSSRGAKRTHRQRCDLVLSPKGTPLRLDTAEQGLFDPVNLCEPGDALWLEVKGAWQFREGGVRHAGYGAQWQSAVVEDLRKMDADPLIRQAGLLLIVFNESSSVLDKDLDLFETVLARKEVLAGFRKVFSFPIQDRIGHTLCTAALWPTIMRHEEGSHCAAVNGE